jgi:hypothetical protein
LPAGGGTGCLAAQRIQRPPKAIHWNEGFGSILRLCTALFATKALGDECEYERVEGNSFRFGASGELRMHCLWDTSYEFPGRYTTRIRRRNRVALGLERSDGGFQGFSPVVQRFLDRFSVGDAFSEVRKGNEKPPSFLGGEWANFEWVVSELAHASCSVHEVNELLQVDRLDRTTSGDRQRFAIIPNKHTVATPIVPPTNALLLRHGLKLSDLPVKWTTPHGSQQLGCRVHGQYDTAGNIGRQAEMRCLRCAAFYGAKYHAGEGVLK